MLGAAFLLQLSKILPTFSHHLGTIPTTTSTTPHTSYLSISDTNPRPHQSSVAARPFCDYSRCPDYFLIARNIWEIIDKFQKETVAMECGHLERVVGKNGFQASNFPSLTDLKSKLECGECGDTSSVWVCISCGALNCGRYIKAHGLLHKVELNIIIYHQVHNM